MWLCLHGAICSRKSASCYVQNSNTQNQLEVGFGTVFGAPVHCDLGTFTSPRAEIFHVGAHSSAHDLHSGSRLLMPTLESFLVLVFASFCCMYLALSVISICFLCAGWICLVFLSVLLISLLLFLFQCS
jgi:hypothetical protein